MHVMHRRAASHREHLSQPGRRAIQPRIPCMMLPGRHLEGRLFPRRRPAVRSGRRDALLLSIMGSPDPRQIDGLGGAHPLTSKVAIVSRSTAGRIATSISCSAQVAIDEPRVDITPNCGNILAGIGPFAIERGLVAAQRPADARARPDGQHRHGRRAHGADAEAGASPTAAMRASTACPARRRRSRSSFSMRPARSAARCCRPAMRSIASPASRRR